MYKKIMILGFIATATLSIMSLNTAPKQFVLDEPTEKIYTQYCASCHGEKVEAFVDRKWKHGNTKPELVASITNGYNDMGMPTWKGILSPKDIDKLADLIIENLAGVEQYKFEKKPKSNIFVSEGVTVKLDTIATGFDSPWGFAQLPNKDYLISDRKGKLYLVDQKRNKTEITGIPAVMAKGQGGLLDIALHPKFAQNGWVYMSYSKFKMDGSTTLTSTGIVRGKIKNNMWVESQELFESLPYTKTFQHFGSRITFDKKGYMFFSVGERGMEKVMDDVYQKIKTLEAKNELHTENVVRELYKPFTTEEISDKIAQLITPDNIQIPVEVIYQTIEGLHACCPTNTGDWYFTGNYPTPGGNKVCNKAYTNYIEGNDQRGY